MEIIKKECLNHILKSIECQFDKKLEAKIENDKIVIKDKSNNKLKIKLIQKDENMYFELEGFSELNEIEYLFSKVSYLAVNVTDNIVKIFSSESPLCSGVSMVSELLCILIKNGLFE